MNMTPPNHHAITLLAGTLAIVCIGCVTPQHNNGGKFRGDRVPRTAAGQQAPTQQQLATRPVATPQATAPQAAPYDQVSYEQAAYRQPPPQPAAPVEQYIPATLAGHRSNNACGCNSCGTNECADTSCKSCAPQGYLMMSPQGWNAFGIDPQEFLCDGGDQSPDAIVRRDDSLGGLGLEDTVVHYTTHAGDIHVQPSNRACLYAPRFVSVRKITGAVAGGRAIGLGGLDRPIGPIRVEHDLPGLVVTESTELGHADVSRRIDAMRDRNRGVPVEGILQPELAADVLAAISSLKLYDLGQLRDNELAIIERLALAAVPWTIDESLEVVIEDLRAPTLTRDERVEAFTVYDFPDAGRLRIVKMADRSDALPGEIVTFVIRVDNVGDAAVNNVVLADNLTTRLEYVADSQTVEGAEAEFSTSPNEGQSSKLKWMLTEELKVGESVTIRFETKVR